ncbi:hypothetical protein GCM10010234_67700 [Streptomyces hawaiiensis]
MAAHLRVRKPGRPTSGMPLLLISVTHANAAAEVLRIRRVRTASRDSPMERLPVTTDAEIALRSYSRPASASASVSAFVARRGPVGAARGTAVLEAAREPTGPGSRPPPRVT